MSFQNTCWAPNLLSLEEPLVNWVIWHVPYVPQGSTVGKGGGLGRKETVARFPFSLLHFPPSLFPVLL